MGRIITLLVVLVLVYFIYAQSLPWLKQSLGVETDQEVGGVVPGGESRCVETAWQANETFVGQVRLFPGPPIDPLEWSVSFQLITRGIGAAEIACSSCLSEACRKAATAASELRSLSLQFDDMARRNQLGWGNRTTQQERINRLLNEARRLNPGS
jgi:hypothetical protein